MNYNKEKIERIVKKLLKDINRTYIENKPIKIDFKNSVKPLFLKKEIINVWDVTVYVYEDQFPEKEELSIIVITISDETLDIISYADMSCGRPVPMKASLNVKGIYELVLLE